MPRPEIAQAELALRRYRAFEDSVALASRTTDVFVAGLEDGYWITEQDLRIGTQHILANYHRGGVNGIGLLLPYRSAVSVESSERIVRILALTGEEPPPAPPSLLTPQP